MAEQCDKAQLPIPGSGVAEARCSRKRGHPGAHRFGASVAGARPAALAADGRTMFGVDEVAARWGLDRKTIYAAIHRGEIPAVAIGGTRKRYLVPREFVERSEKAVAAGCTSGHHDPSQGRVAPHGGSDGGSTR